MKLLSSASKKLVVGDQTKRITARADDPAVGHSESVLCETTRVRSDELGRCASFIPFGRVEHSPVVNLILVKPHAHSDVGRMDVAEVVSDPLTLAAGHQGSFGADSDF